MSAVIYNNTLYSTQEAVLPYNTRAFRYGDGIFETMRMIHGRVALFDQHMDRMRQGADYLKIKCPREWTNAFFYDEIQELVATNKLGKQARIRLSLFRAGDGYYTPKKNTASYLLECERFGKMYYPLNAKGLNVGLYYEIEKGIPPFANLKSINAQIYVMAGLYKKAQKLDDCLLLNGRTRIAEAISSNVFLVKDHTLFTPPLSEGCVDGVMRRHIIQLADGAHVPVHQAPLKLEDLFEAHELFLVNAISGIRWVGRFKIKTFDHKMAVYLSERLNEEAARAYPAH